MKRQRRSGSIPAWRSGPAPTRRPGCACAGWPLRGATLSRPGTRVLDYGCGSGILAIAAMRFGAAAVDAVDIDPAGVAATRSNARANGVDVRAGDPTLATGRYRVIVANILATPLTLLAPLLCGHLAPGGELVLAGILERQADALRAAYAAFVALETGACEDGWILMTGTRPLEPCMA